MAVTGKQIFIALAAVLIVSLACAAQVQVRPAPAPPKLLNDLKSKDAATRRNAANQIGALRSRDGVRPLTAALKDADSSVREAAAFALGQLANPAATDALTRALSDKDSEARVAAAFALGMIGDRKSIEPLSDALTDEDAGVRAGAAIALGIMQDEAAVDELVALLDDPSYDARYDAVWAIGQIGEPDSGEHLRAALTSIDSLNLTDARREEFRRAVQYALENLRTEEKAQARPRRAISTVTRTVSISEVFQAVATERALRAKVKGVVKLRVLVGADGRAVRAYVIKRLGFGLDQRATQAVLQYKFDPAIQARLPQTTWMEIEVRF